jgi:hypothetical protein
MKSGRPVSSSKASPASAAWFNRARCRVASAFYANVFDFSLPPTVQRTV